MELLLILIYVSICYAVFKIFRIPVNQWSLATAALGGIIGIALLLLIMNYNHPFTTNARIYFAVTPVFPSVRGRVIEVPVQPNAPLKEGDVLFRIDPKPYEFVVDQKKRRRKGQCPVRARRSRTTTDRPSSSSLQQTLARSHAASRDPSSAMSARMSCLLRKAAERTIEGLHRCVRSYIRALDPSECRGYFRHAGYEPL